MGVEAATPQAVAAPVEKAPVEKAAPAELAPPAALAEAPAKAESTAAKLVAMSPAHPPVEPSAEAPKLPEVGPPLSRRPAKFASLYGG